VEQKESPGKVVPLEMATPQKQLGPLRPAKAKVEHAEVHASTVLAAEVAIREKPGKPAADGGAPQPA